MRSIAVTQYLQRWESLNNGQLPCQPSYLEMAVGELRFQVVEVENGRAAIRVVSVGTMIVADNPGMRSIQQTSVAIEW